jgi:hypothetical protein
MINMVLLLGLLASILFFGCVQQLHRYHKTKYKPSLYMGVACSLWTLTSVIGMLIAVVNSVNNLPLVKFLGRYEVTSGVSGFVFLNMFAVAMTRPGEKMHKVWISLVSFLALTVGVWTCNIFVGGDICGIPTFTETSMYKAPYGLPIVEAALTSMAVLAAYPIYLFLRGAKETGDTVVRTKSLLMGIGIIIAAAGYAIEMTGAIPYQYMPIAIPMIFAGFFATFFAYDMPKQIEKIIHRRAPTSEELVESFVEEYFVSPVEPTARTQPNAFSKALGLNHQQMAGRKILFEFDPASQYEMAVQDLTTEALANAEPTAIFTRRGSAIYSALMKQKAVKFFCLTEQVSVPTEFSENEMLLSTNDTSLMLDVLNKTLKAHPEARINVVFDSLSDLIMAIGFEKTYRFIRYTIEMLASPRTTILFLLNQTAHDPQIASSIKSLFSNQISYGKEGIQPVKLSARSS